MQILRPIMMLQRRQSRVSKIVCRGLMSKSITLQSIVVEGDRVVAAKVKSLLKNWFEKYEPVLRQAKTLPCDLEFLQQWSLQFVNVNAGLTLPTDVLVRA